VAAAGRRGPAVGCRPTRRVAAGLDNAWLYEQAQRAIRAREELLAIVSHDLKNPLAVILMSTALMDTPPGVDERRRSRRQIETIKRSAARMNRLIQDLLDTARIEAGKLSVERRRVEVAPLVRETIEAMQSLAASKSLQLTSHLPHDLPEVSGDASRLQQVFANLVGNAIKFTPDGGSITIRAKVAGDEILFSITDTGSGIPKNELPYLFDRFWQARRTARSHVLNHLILLRFKSLLEAGARAPDRAVVPLRAATRAPLLAWPAPAAGIFAGQARPTL